MIADHQTNVVYVADTLERRFPAVYGGLKTILTEHGIPFRTIPGTRDVWCRDYMPVQVAEDRFVQFRYAPDYLTEKYRHLRTDGQIGPTLAWVASCEWSKLVLDGGNVVSGEDRVFVCDKVFRENPDWGPSELVRKLGQLLEVDRVIVIPSEPGDVVGHADGVVRFVERNVVLVNDYRGIDSAYGAKLRRMLIEAGLEVIELPYSPKNLKAGKIPSAFGCYLNYLRVGPLIVLPTYGLVQDQMAYDRLRQLFPNSQVQALDCSVLSEEGGVLNCISWNVLDGFRSY